MSSGETPSGVLLGEAGGATCSSHTDLPVCSHLPAGTEPETRHYFYASMRGGHDVQWVKPELWMIGVPGSCPANGHGAAGDGSVPESQAESGLERLRWNSRLLVLAWSSAARLGIWRGNQGLEELSLLFHVSISSSMCLFFK